MQPANEKTFAMTINGRRLTANDGESVLTVAKRAGIDIPTLCHHPAIEDFGSCRLCLVEVTKPEWKGWQGLMTACLYPAAKDLIVETQSERVRHVRRNVLDLLLARCPESQVIQQLASDYGVTRSSFTPRADADLCILCGLCVRVCESAVTAAIATLNRGRRREVGPPFGDVPPDCVGCTACAHVCPTGHIIFTEDKGVRTIWNKKFELLRCQKCHEPLLTVEQRDHLLKTRDLDVSYYELCPGCKRQRTAETFADVVLKTHPHFVPKQMGGSSGIPTVPFVQHKEVRP